MDVLTRAVEIRQKAIFDHGPQIWDNRLTVEHVAGMIEHGNLCALCLLRGSPLHPLGLDRIVHNGPYTHRNIRTVHGGCNYFRDGLTDAEMYEMVYEVYEHLRVVLGPGVPITAEAALEALTAALVPRETVPVVHWDPAQVPAVPPEQDAIDLGEDPYWFKAVDAWSSAVELHGPELLERAPLPWWLETLDKNCYMCDRASVPHNWGCIDRVVPGAAGGEYGPHNGLPCCNRCNRSKFDRPLVDHLRTLLAIHATAGFQAWLARHHPQ